MAVTDLKDAIDEILDEIRTIKEIRRVPEEPPENNDVFPFVVGFPGEGSYGGYPNVMVALHNPQIELHVARKDLARDYSNVMNLIDEIPYQLKKKLKDREFSTVVTFGLITYIFQPLQWAGVDTLGVVYTINELKVVTNIT